MMKSNYYCFRKLEDQYLITNEFGRYCFLREDDFQALIQERYLDITESSRTCLLENDFIYDVPEEVYLHRVIQKYRDSKNYLFRPTELFILVMTNQCNMACEYCQAQDSAQEQHGLMKWETAKKAAETILQSPGQYISVEFQGGEPLFNFDVIRKVVEYLEDNKNDKAIQYNIVTNSLLLNPEIIEFFLSYHINVSTSLDGPEVVHDQNRHLLGGGGTYRKVSDNIATLQEKGVALGAIQTTTRYSLPYAREIVREYARQKMDTVFLRPLTRLGYARENWEKIGYTAEDFLAFYEESIKEILQMNSEGHIIKEGHAMIFLRNIIGHYAENYMELRSPCGAASGQMAFYYDGSVYTCDEGRMLAEMGIPDFRLGSVDDTYDSLMGSGACKLTCQASVLECLPECCDCAYHPYCGTCPVINFAMDGSLYAVEANNYRCRIYQGILDILFQLMTSEENRRIFDLWVENE